MKNNSLGMKALMAAVTLALTAYFGFQAYQYFTDPLTTTLAYTYQVDEAISLSGYVVREERVLTDHPDGVVQILREEGERVSVGGAVAAVYADASVVDAQTKAETLSARMEQLEYALEAETGVEVAQKLDQQIFQNLLDYRAAVTADKLSDAEKQGAQLRAQVIKRDYTNADTEGLQTQIEELRAQVKELQSQTAGSVQKVKSPVSGLYSAVVDGYETVLTPESILEMTPSQLDRVEADGQTDSEVGKLVLGTSWYYAAVMSGEDALRLQKQQEAGTQLTLRFTTGVERDLAVTLQAVGTEENGKCVAVFRGQQYLSLLTLLREQSARIISSTLEGIRVPEEALRVVTTTKTMDDGTEQESQSIGVYCVVGLEARFKPVEILYRGDNFALVKAAAPASREVLRLRPGDEIIVAARDLYDGKVVG